MDTNTEIKIKSVSDMLYGIKHIHNQIKQKKPDERFDGLLWFRGHSDKDWELIPSVQRSNYKNEKTEQRLVNGFLMKACTLMENPPNKDEYVPGWMTVMQHYGLPARLLDWPASPLSALFFSTYKHKKYSNRDGCIWVLGPGMLNGLEGFEPAVYPMDKDSVRNMPRPAFHAHQVSVRETDKIIACCPVEKNMRVYTQQSAFTVHNSRRKTADTGTEKERILYKFIIPSECKPDILKELKILGITLSNIYPDAEHIAKEIRESWKCGTGRQPWKGLPHSSAPATGQIWSGLTYSRMSDTPHSRMEQRVSSVFVVIASPCFIRCSVLAGMPCLKIRAYSVTPLL